MNRMKLAGVLAWAALSVGYGQTGIDLRTQSRNVDFTQASVTKPVKMGTELPASCTTGALFFKSDVLAGGNLYGCTSTDTWTVLAPNWMGGDVEGDPGSLVVTGIRGNAVTPGIPANGAILRWNTSLARWEFAADSAHAHALTDLTGITGSHGSGGVLQKFTGTSNPGECAQFDGNGNLVSTGAACGTGSGGGGGGVPYTGAIADLNLGAYQLSAATVSTGSSGQPSRIEMTQGSCPAAASPGFDLVLCVEAGVLYSVDAGGVKKAVGGGGGGGTGDVVGPASSTDATVAVFSGTGGKLIQATPVTIATATGNLLTPGSVTSGSGSGAAGSVVARRGTGTAKLSVQGSTAGEWSIAPAASFTSWSFTPPTAPCSAHQWWTTDSSGIGSCTQPAASDLSDGTTLMHTNTSVLAAQMPALTGDASSPAGSTATTVGKVNGVTYPGSPAVNSVPVVSGVNAVAYMPVPDCLDSGGNHLNYNASTHAFSCGTTGGSVASTAFSGISSGTNTSAAMTCGAGCTVTASGGGVVNANQINGAAAAASATTDTTNAGNISSGTLPAARLPGAARIRGFGITLDGGGSSIATGQKGYAQVGYACTITGWSVIANQAGSLTVELDRRASTAPPAAPLIPNTTSDKISAGAPIGLSSAQSAAGGASEVSTWSTAIGQWDSIGWNVTSASGVTRATIQVFCQI